MSNVREPGGGSRGRGLMGRFGRDRSGAIVPIFALCVTVALGTAALAVDYGRWHSERTTLALTADAAALFGAAALTTAQAAGQSDAAARAEMAALSAIQVNIGADGTPTITVTETPGSVKVVLRKQGQRTFSGAVLPQDVSISVEAEAAIGPATKACAIALDSNAAKGIEFDGSGTLTAHNCGIWSNSTSATSIDAEGSGSATAAAICAAGGINTGNHSFNPPPQVNCPPAQDPLAQWTPPAIGAVCDYTNAAYSGSQIYQLNPGVYCGGITGSGGVRLVLNPGLYMLKDGPLRLNGGASIEGQGVAFLLTGAGSSVDLGGSSVVHLSAPLDGAMAGLVLAAGRNEPVAVSRIRGQAELFLEGSVYLPTHDLEFQGGPAAAVPAASTVLIARTIKFSGSSTIQFGSSSGTTSMPDHSAEAHVPGNVRLMR